METPKTTTVYTPKNIMITGGCGFIGGHVVTLLTEKYPQYNIINYDMLDYCSSLKNVQHLEKLGNYQFVKGSILSADLVAHVIRTQKVDTIMHFAAQTHVDNSFGNSFQFTESNVMGTHVLLEAAKEFGIKRFIHVSTDEVVGELALEQTKSSYDMLAPTNPYAATKASAELLVRSYARSFNLPFIITRSNNVYGPGQFPEKIIPKFISLLHRGRPCYIHGNGHNKRNYIYAEDVARAFELILHQGETGHTYNIAIEEVHDNIEVAKHLIKAFGLEEREQEMLHYVEDRLFNDKRYHIDPTALLQLGWRQEVNWEEGMRRTIAWYRDSAHQNQWVSPVEPALVAHPRVGARTAHTVEK